MQRPALLPSFLLALIIGGCAQPAETPPAASAAAAPPLDAAALRDTIQAREREWSAAYLAGNATAVANLYTEDGAQVQAAGDWRRGRDAISAGMKTELDTLNVTAREDITEEVIPAGDYIVEFGRYTYTATTKKGNKPVTGAGRYVVVWRKDADGQWRLHRDLGSDAPKK